MFHFFTARVNLSFMRPVRRETMFQRPEDTQRTKRIHMKSWSDITFPFMVRSLNVEHIKIKNYLNQFNDWRMFGETIRWTKKYDAMRESSLIKKESRGKNQCSAWRNQNLSFSHQRYFRTIDWEPQQGNVNFLHSTKQVDLQLLVIKEGLGF